MNTAYSNFDGFTPVEVTKKFYVDSIVPSQRGKSISLKDMYGLSGMKPFIENVKVHDANFAFLSTTLEKLYQDVVKPMYYITYQQDIPLNVGGGFVDYVTYYSVDWAGIMNEYNITGNDANYIPRVNAGLNRKSVNVYTWQVAYDLRFVELEKMKKLTLQKSIQEIYKNAIVAGWDLFAQKVAYTGINGGYGLFNNPNVMITTIDNSSTTGQGFEGLSDATVVAFFNGVFETYLLNSGNNLSILPNTFLFPLFVGTDLSSRFSELYTSSLRKFIKEHNLGIDESDKDMEVVFRSREALNTLGTAGKGRIVAYRNDETFVRMDVPYPIQHFITLPNIDKMSYTSAFVGQISAVQLPYNNSDKEFGPVTYWDFTTSK